MCFPYPSRLQLHLHPFRLRLREPFTVSHGTRTHQDTLVVELRHGPHRGFGEAPAIFYYHVTVAAMAERLNALRGPIEAADGRSPGDFWQQLAPTLADQPFALAAVDEAYQDLTARRAGTGLRNQPSADARPVLSNYTIGLDSAENMVRKLRAFPWPVYKIKLGTPDDVALVRELRRHTQAPFRVDANGGWTVPRALAALKAFEALNVELVEQPLPPADHDGMRTLYAASRLPLLADESCQGEADVAACAGLFHGVNVKLAKCGGLTPARRMVTQARALGLRVMVGCMTESTVGISAAAQLLPLADYADLDAPLLLADDVATGVVLRHGQVLFPDAPGTGVRLHDDLTALRLVL